MAERLLVMLWISVLLSSYDCRAQTVQEIVERSNRAMEPPIKFLLNGKSCLVLKQKLDDGTVAIRMEFASPASLVRIETASASYEIYPKCKSSIDLSFMGAASNSQLSDVLGLIGARGRSSTAEELQLTSETEFEGKKCWKITQSLSAKSGSPTPAGAAAEVGNPGETVYYIDKQSYHLVCMETISITGKRILQTKISDIEKPLDWANELFLPPVDFTIRKPQSIVEYLSTRESLIRTQELLSSTQELKNRMNAIQSRTKSTIAAVNANTNALRRTSSRLAFAMPIFGVCMFVVFVVLAILSQRRMAAKWKHAMNDPAAAQAEIARMMNATNLSIWTRFTRAPLVLKAFVIYSVCAVAFGFVLPIGAYSSVGGLRYLVPLFITFTALSRLELRRSVYLISALMVMYGAIGIFQFMSFQSIATILPNRSRSGALFVVLDIAMPIVMPIAWALLLLSPSMQKWLRAKSDDEFRVNQIAMADLLYFMFVASLAMIALVTMIRMTN